MSALETRLHDLEKNQAGSLTAHMTAEEVLILL